MIQFLAPREVKTNWLIYLGSAVFTIIGIITLGSALVSQIITSRVDTKSLPNPEAISAEFSKNELLVTNLLPFVIGFLLLAFCAKMFHLRTFLSFITARERFDFARFGLSFLIWGIVMAVLFIIELSGENSIQWNYDAKPFFVLMIITLVVIPLQTGFEEVFLRGFLLQMFGRTAKRGIIAILSTAVIFGIMHLGNPEIDTLGWQAIVFYLFSGIMTALITVLDDGIELSWGFHMANNAFGILILTNRWQAFQTDALFMNPVKPTGGFDLLIIPFVLYPLFVLLLWKIYKWKNWKEKLFQPIPLNWEPNKDDLLD